MDPFFERAPDGYRVTMAPEVRFTPVSLSWRSPGGETAERSSTPWSGVAWAFVADIGEPEGVRTIVFDLVTEMSDAGCVIVRFDAEPGEEAQAVAKVVLEAIGPHCGGASLRDLAKEGTPSRWYPDLESFEESNWAELRRGAVSAVG